jgi:L-glyceraldehyde 3-phosphate reductase
MSSVFRRSVVRPSSSSRVIIKGYQAAPDRYQSMTYRRSGRPGRRLPPISLGRWHNVGNDRPRGDST